VQINLIIALFFSFIESTVFFIYHQKAIRKLLFKKCEPLFSTLNGSAKLNIPCFLCCTTKSSPFRHSFLNFFLLKNRTITIEIEQKNVYKITVGFLLQKCFYLDWGFISILSSKIEALLRINLSLFILCRYIFYRHFNLRV